MHHNSKIVEVFILFILPNTYSVHPPAVQDDTIVVFHLQQDRALNEFGTQ